MWERLIVIILYNDDSDWTDWIAFKCLEPQSFLFNLDVSSLSLFVSAVPTDDNVSEITPTKDWHDIRRLDV